MEKEVYRTKLVFRWNFALRYGQGYFQSTPYNYAYDSTNRKWRIWIKPRILLIKAMIYEYIKFKNENPTAYSNWFIDFNFNQSIFKNQEHINLIKDAMYSSSNEPGGTLGIDENKVFTFAGKKDLLKSNDLLKHREAEEVREFNL